MPWVQKELVKAQAKGIISDTIKIPGGIGMGGITDKIRNDFSRQTKQDANMSDSEEIYQVITANRLRDGLIVYLTKDDSVTGWTETIGYAHIAGEDEIEALLATAKTYEDSNVVVGTYAVEIAGSKVPLTARERIRAAGPSVRYGDDAVPFNSSDFEI